MITLENEEYLESVLVLMSTYNGEKYIQEQITSILTQDNVQTILIIRDDGSTDSTVSIIQDFMSKYSNIYVINGTNIGCKNSFYELCSYSQKYFPSIEYYAFADQDDYWKPNKLYEGIKKLKKENKNFPLLYYCQTTLVDRELNYIKQIHSKTDTDNFIEVCISYPASGCTMIFNKSSLELFILGVPEHMYLHDSWMIKMVAACNGIIIKDENSYILYRQHGTNVVGASNTFISVLKRRFAALTEKRCQRSKELRNILKTYESFITPNNLKTINTFVNYKNNIISKTKLLFSSKYKYRNSSNIFFKISILLNLF